MFDDALVLLTTIILLVVPVLAGPVGVVDVTGSATETRLGGGNATVSDVSVPRDAFRMTPGRFGTNVYYLRIPDVTVDVGSVTGTPRIVYRVTFPSLEFDRIRTKLVGESGRVRVAMDDRAFPSVPGITYDRVEAGAYAGEVVVRVQSFEVDRTVYRRTVIVEVQADE